MKWAALLIAAVALTACTGTGPVRTSRVLVPTVANCVPGNLPAKPTYPDTDPALLGAADAAERYRLLIVGREIRVARLGTLEGVVEACAGETP